VKLLWDCHVRDDVRITALRVAGVDCRCRITISRRIRDSAIRVERSRVWNRVDLGERATGGIAVRSAIHVITNNVG
jgi:hypothetical protein